MPSNAFRFTLPSLPKEWYTVVTEAREAYSLTQWQVTILALACLKRLHQLDADRVKDLAKQVKEGYQHG